jgi:hypothetical protein
LHLPPPSSTMDKSTHNDRMELALADLKQNHPPRALAWQIHISISRRL